MSITTIRPDGTVLDVATTKVPSTTAHLNIDDSPVNDATYVTGTTTGSGIRTSLQNLSALSGNQRVKQVRHRMRYFHDSADVGWREYVDCRLRDSVTGKATVVEQQGTVSNTAIEGSGQWYTTAPDGGAWSETDVNNLLSDVAWRASGGGAYLRVTEVYVDVDINTQPVAGTVTVTNATTSTRPTVSWAPSDSDGDALTRWRVRVIPQSVTVIGGFNPWTSNAAWDSGIQSGVATTTQVGVDLINGTAYVAYAWVAQDWPGPSGPIWWSAASASSTFTITLIPPGTPVLSAAVETQLPDFRVRLSTEDTQNLLTSNDSEFEVNAGTWAGRVNSTAARSTAQFVNGVASLQQTATAGGDAIAGTALGASGYTVVPGVAYSAGFKTRTAVTARAIRAQIEWFNAAGSSISVSEGASDSDATNWTTVGPFVQATAPATARTAAVRWRVLSAAAAEVHYIDQVWFRRGTFTAAQGPALAGQTTGTVRIERHEPMYFGLRGSPNNLIAQQLYAPGSIEGDLSGFNKSGALDSIYLEYLDRAWPDTTGVGAGAHMVHWQVRSGFTDLLYIGVGTNLSDLTYPRYRMPVVQGLPYIGWGWFWSTVQSFAAQMIIQWVDDAGTLVSQTLGGVTTVTSTPQAFAVTATPPAGATAAFLILQNSFSSAYDEVYGTAFGWAQGTSIPTEIGPGVIEPMVFEPIRTETLTVLPGQTLRAYDMETPGGRPVYYRARTEVVLSGQTVASPWSKYVAVQMPVPGTTLLKNPLKPDEAALLKREPEVDETQAEAAWVGIPAGGDRPIKIRDNLTGWDGQLTLNYESNTERRQLDRLLEEGGTLLLQWHDGGQKYLSIVERSGGNVRSGWGRLRVGYIETGRP